MSRPRFHFSALQHPFIYSSHTLNPNFLLSLSEAIGCSHPSESTKMHLHQELNMLPLPSLCLCFQFRHAAHMGAPSHRLPSLPRRFISVSSPPISAQTPLLKQSGLVARFIPHAADAPSSQHLPPPFLTRPNLRTSSAG